MGGTHPGFGYPLQNRPRDLRLSTRSRPEKERLSLTQELPGGGLSEGHSQFGLERLARLVQGKHPGLYVLAILIAVVKVFVSG